MTKVGQDRRLMFRRLVFLLLLMRLPIALSADERVRVDVSPLAHCGELNAQPFGDPKDVFPRKCDSGERKYNPRYHGIGFEILDSESQACFVPDQEYQTLDEIIDAVVQRVKYDDSLIGRDARLEQARMISKTVSDVLTEHGFRLYIPTDTLSDALLDRNAPGESKRHIFDCDTGSLIFLTVAENLGAPVAMTDTTLPSGAGHNYVRWRIDDETSMNWDMNSRAECLTLPNLRSYEGVSMTRLETLGYARALRAKMWQAREFYDEAVSDYRTAMKLYPQAPIAYNNLAWLVATRVFPARDNLRQDAILASERAISIDRTANYLDTAGCVYAFAGDFQKASKYESEAVAKAPRNTEFQARLVRIEARQNCTGSK
jgi:tetratricopeptide (TPR) repeat protein